METFDVASWDGTRLACYRGGDRGGVPVVVSAGLGTPPSAWPELTRTGSGFDVVGFNPRGMIGSGRPEDSSAITIADYARDVLHLVDVLDVPRALVVAWSLGVNAAFEAAVQAPDRVAGVLGVAGVPGGTFSTMGAPWGVPGPLRRPLSITMARLLRTTGPVVQPVVRRLPSGPTARALRLARVTERDVDQDLLTENLEHYLRHDLGWFFRTAVAQSRHERMDPTTVSCPVTLLAADRDVLTSPQAVRTVARQMREAGADVEVVSLQATHYLPLERPAVVAGEARALARRAGLLARAATA